LGFKRIILMGVIAFLSAILLCLLQKAQVENTQNVALMIRITPVVQVHLFAWFFIYSLNGSNTSKLASLIRLHGIFRCLAACRGVVHSISISAKAGFCKTLKIRRYREFIADSITLEESSVANHILLLL